MAAIAVAGGLGLVAFGASGLAGSPDSPDSLVAIMVIGCLFCLLGAALAASWVAGRIAAVAERLPLSLRLVARDTGRQRFRTAVAVAGLVVVLAAPVMVVSAANSAEAEAREQHTPAALSDEVVVHLYAYPVEDPETAATVASDRFQAGLVGDLSTVVGVESWGVVEPLGLGDGAIDEVWAAPSSNKEPGGWAALGTPEAVAALRLPASVNDTLASGSAVVLDGPIGLWNLNVSDGEAQRTIEVPVEVAAARPRTWAAPAILVPPAMADEFGLVAIESSPRLFVVADAPVTSAQSDAISDIVINGFDIDAAIGFGFEIGEPFQPFAALVRNIAVPISIAVVLVLGGCLIAIAATESDRDVASMVRVGAPPSMRRWFNGLSGWYHALLGAVLGAPVGLLLLVALRRAVDEPPPLQVPWSTLAAVVVGAPVLLGLVLATLMRSTAPRAPSGR